MRKLFSVIICAYDSGWIIETAIKSIIAQNMSNDIEIIISDDCSEESYDNIISKYINEIDIKVVKTDYNCCPGNTRQRGVEYATGEWITFMDADDYYISDTFKNIKRGIEKHPEVVHIISPINIIDTENNIRRVIPGYSGWTHGKFYNMDRLWKKYNISYKKDLLSHEDIYLTSVVNSIITDNSDIILEMKDAIYNWKRWPQTVSSKRYNKDNDSRDFLEIYFSDYITATGYVFLEYYKNKKTTKDFALGNALNVLQYCYYYCQFFIYNHPQTFLRKNIDLSRKYWNDFKETFQYSTEDIYIAISLDDCYSWEQVRQASKHSIDNIIEPMSFREWMMLMDGKIDIPDFSYITIT